MIISKYKTTFFYTKMNRGYFIYPFKLFYPFKKKLETIHILNSTKSLCLVLAYRSDH